MLKMSSVSDLKRPTAPENTGQLKHDDSKDRKRKCCRFTLDNKIPGAMTPHRHISLEGIGYYISTDMAIMFTNMTEVLFKLTKIVAHIFLFLFGFGEHFTM